MDAPNARPAYHYIMMRGLAHLAHNQEILTLGAPKKDKAVEALLIVNRALAYDAAWWRESKSAEALDALALLVSAQYRRGGAPLGPSERGMFLEFVVWRTEQAARKL